MKDAKDGKAESFGSDPEKQQAEKLSGAPPRDSGGPPKELPRQALRPPNWALRLPLWAAQDTPKLRRSAPFWALRPPTLKTRLLVVNSLFCP